MTVLSTRFAAVARTLCALTLVAAPAVARAADEVNLAPKFEKGTKTKFIMTLNADSQATSAEASTEAMGSHVEQTIGLVLNVKESDPEKGSIVDLTYESFKMKGKQGDQTFEFDSTKSADTDKENPVAQAFRPIIGATITLTIDSNGMITNIAGGDSLASPALSGFVSQESLRVLIGPIFTAKSGPTTVKVGDTWTNEDVLPGNMKITSTQTLKSVENGLANVDITGKMDLSTLPMMPNMTVKESTYDGSYVWDTKGGMLKSMKTNQNTTATGDMGTLTFKKVMTVTRAD